MNHVTGHITNHEIIRIYDIIAMLVSTFSILNKDSRVWFFEKSFLLVDVKPDVVFGMLILIISNVDMHFKA